MVPYHHHFQLFGGTLVRNVESDLSLNKKPKEEQFLGLILVLKIIF